MTIRRFESLRVIAAQALEGTPTKRHELGGGKLSVPGFETASPKPGIIGFESCWPEPTPN